MMATVVFPPLAMVRARLNQLTQAEMHQLAADSGVPFPTLMKIRHGTTKNPGLETVRKFFPLLPGAEK